MKDNFIQLNKDSVLRLKIVDMDGIETGEVLTFDLEDIELPLKYQELLESHKKNVKNIKNQLTIIDKREDVKGKKLYSKNQEDKIRALNEYFKNEEKVYDMFLGENGVKKLLNGRKLGWTTLDEIDDIIEKQIAPYLEGTMDNIKNKVNEKYNKTFKKNKNNILKVDDEDE